MKTERNRLAALLDSATPQGIMIMLGKLLALYPQQTMSEGMMKQKFEIYLEDLRDCPAWALSDVAKEYRHNPDNQFYPMVSVLLAGVNKLILPIKNKIATIEAVLREMKATKKPEERITDAQWKELKDSMRRIGA